MKETIIEDFKVNFQWRKGITLSKDLYGRTRSGSLWKSINTRCKNYGSVNNFENFQDFTEHMQTLQFLMEKEKNGKFWQIDKDFNLSGDRSYSKENVIMLPNEINSFITNMDKDRELPLGVVFIDRTFNGNKGLSKPYRANCKDRAGFGSTVYLEYFSTPEEAHLAWLSHKRDLLLDKKNKPLLKNHELFQRFVEDWLDAFSDCIANPKIFIK